MRKHIINILLIIIIMCMIALYFDDYYISQVLFDRSLENYKMNMDYNYNYTPMIITQDNAISSVCLSISEVCMDISEFIIVFFSNFISMIL